MQQSPNETPSTEEIERKFILREIPEFMKVQLSKYILQGYLPSFRIRKIGNEYKMTIKRGKGVKRQEFEINITQMEFDHNWIIGKEQSLTKTRFYMEVDGREFEADQYHESLDGLFTIEVEFKTEEEAYAFMPPSWFGEEVTEDDDFSNGSLAKNGLTEHVKEKIRQVNEILGNTEAMKLNLNDGVKWIVNGAVNLTEKAKGEKSIFIGISGGSNSGKTTRVTDEVISKLTEQGITVTKISMDDFYYGPSYMKKMEELGTPLNFDEPGAYNMVLFSQKLQEIIDGKDVKINVYDFQGDPKVDAQDIKKAQIYIIEGLFALTDEATKGICDLKAFVNVSSHGRVIRRLIRDGGGKSGETGRTGQSHNDILEQVLSTVEPMDKKYVQPQTKNTHIIIDNDHNPAMESSNIKNSDSQLKFKLEDINLERISEGLKSIGFEALTIRDEIDFYYSHVSKDLMANGEIFRLRYLGEDVGKAKSTKKTYPTLTYKYSEENDSHREESILDFEVSDRVVDLIDNEYSEIGYITKNRTPFTKDNISIVIDTNILGNLKSEDTITELGDFIELRGFKNEEERTYYTDIVATLINMRMADGISESYLKMLSQ